MNASALAERTNELVGRFKLTTAAAQMAGRLEQAGHQQALSSVRAVLEMEADAREQRQISRRRHASQLPPGKTFDTFELGVFQPALGRKLRELARGEFRENAANLLAFGPPGWVRAMPRVHSATPSLSKAMQCCCALLISSSRHCSPPSVP